MYINKYESRRIVSLAAIVITIVYSYSVYKGHGFSWNVTSRMMLVESLSTHGTSEITPYHRHTGDKSIHNGRYYSDKAPGLSFMTIVVYKPLKTILNKFDYYPSLFLESGKISENYEKTLHVLRALVNLPLSVVMMAVFFAVAVRWSGSTRAAAMTTMVVGFATPVWAWNLSLFGHAAASAMLVIGFGAVYFARRYSGRAGSSLALCAIAGFALSAAVVIEFPVAPVSVMIGFYGLWKVRRIQPRRLAIMVSMVAFIGTITALPLFYYNFVSFGSPLALGYGKVDGFEGMNEGFFGITTPDPAVAYELIFGLYRGLLPLSPIMILAPLATYHMYSKENMRSEAVLLASVIVYFICFASSYHYWNGGRSVGPRHLTPMLAFAALPMVFLWRDWRGWSQVLLYGLFFLSLAMSILTVATVFALDVDVMNPIVEKMIPLFLAGEIKVIPEVAIGGSAWVTLGVNIALLAATIGTIHIVTGMSSR